MVDDVPQNVRLLEAVLVPRGYQVFTANDGLSALELVESEQPDLILLDVMTPGLDGYAVCAHLRENDDTAVLPVIMVTSSIGQEDEGNRGRGGRLDPEALQPRRVAHALGRSSASSATTTRSRPRPPSSPS